VGRNERERAHTREFKLEAVRLSEDPNQSVGVVAESLGVHRSLLQRWRKEFLGLGEDGERKLPADGEETLQEQVKRVRKELWIAKQEREILKKTVAYFAKEGN